ncbi:MAG: hypothetical protein AAB319_08780 [Pseudomonadota bacterium]
MQTNDHSHPNEQVIAALAEPYAFAALLWPAAVGVWLLTVQDQLPMLRYGLYAWLVIIHLAAYGKGRGIGFGNVMLFTSTVVLMACYTHPSLWTLAWLPLLLIGLLAAQRARLSRRSAA